MVLYNTSALENVGGMTGFATGVNTLSGGLLGIGLLLFIFVISFAGGRLINQDPEKNIINSFGITAMFGILFFFLNLVSWQVAIIPLVLFIAIFMIRIIGGD